MRDICHRCGGELSSPDPTARELHPPFCPHCGAPQLLLSDYSEPLSTGAEGVNAGPSTGKLPPPRPNQIDWRMAMQLAAIAALVGAVLSVVAARLPNISFLSSIWVVSASLTVLAMYQRLRPLATMSAVIGAKIGALVGVTLVFFLGLALSIGMVVARYKLHAMADFDAGTAQAVKTQIQQLSASHQVPPESLSSFRSNEFRTAMVLTGFGMVFTGVFVISIFGGLVGGLLRTRRFVPKV